MRARFYLKSQCLVEQTHNKEIVQVRQNARLVVVIDIVQGREKYYISESEDSMQAIAKN